jgi:hypothetical protein
MIESDSISFRSHVQSVDHGVSIVFDTGMPLLHDGFLSFRLKCGASPEQATELVDQLKKLVDRLEFHQVHNPVFEKV